MYIHAHVGIRMFIYTCLQMCTHTEDLQIHTLIQECMNLYFTRVRKYSKLQLNRKLRA